MEIFAVEQNAPYNDLDGYDKQSYHVICKNKEDIIIGTARLLPLPVSGMAITGIRVLAKRAAPVSAATRLIERAEFMVFPFG